VIHEHWIRYQRPDRHGHSRTRTTLRPTPMVIDNRFSVLPIEESVILLHNDQTVKSSKRSKRYFKRQRVGNVTDLTETVEINYVTMCIR
jgi:hypothetical protein